jgi:hypothetical protein
MERCVKVAHRLVAILSDRAVLFQSQPHDQLPEKKIDGRRHHLTHDVPLFDPAFDTQSFNRRGHSVDPSEASGQRQRTTEVRN